MKTWNPIKRLKDHNWWLKNEIKILKLQHANKELNLRKENYDLDKTNDLLEYKIQVLIFSPNSDKAKIIKNYYESLQELSKLVPTNINIE